MGELATFELAVVLDLSPVLPLVLAGTLDNAKVEKVLAQHRAKCGPGWKRNEVPDDTAACSTTSVGYLLAPACTHAGVVSRSETRFSE